MNQIFSKYFDKSAKLIAILIDPEKHTLEELKILAKKIERSSIDLIFVGSSLSSTSYDNAIKTIKKETQKAVILFPGNRLQLSNNADALLNLSLISGRNPDFLIGEHVRSSMFLKQSELEIIPTGYMLIDGGNKTSVEYMSNTQSIPRSKNDIAVATALAGEYLGLKCIYLEAGSGAKLSVPNQMIDSVRKHTNLPIICGGGIKTTTEIQDKWNAGANILVIGSAFENNPSFLEEFYK